MPFPTARENDRQIIKDILESRRNAWEGFVRRTADPVWAACRLLTFDETEARERLRRAEEHVVASARPIALSAQRRP